MRFHTPERRLSICVCVCTVAVLLMPSLSTAQTYQVQQRAASSSASASTGCTQPLHFGEHPIEDLLGTEVASAQMQNARLRDS